MKCLTFGVTTLTGAQSLKKPKNYQDLLLWKCHLKETNLERLELLLHNDEDPSRWSMEELHPQN